MHRVRNLLILPGLVFSGALLLLLRYILKTPQPLVSTLPGSEHLYKWTHGPIFYKVHGNVDAPPLLLLHAPGIGASAHAMRPLMEQLAPHYCIYAPDLLGFGLSATPDIDYTADLFIALCRDFLRDIVQQPAMLLARGLSCQYALAVTSRYPELCTQLVLLPDGAVNPGSIDKRILARPYSWLSWMISRSTLFGTFMYALLTPRIILRQILEMQNGRRSVNRDDLNYAFVAAHQLGAQYAALAFVMGKLNLDVRLEMPSQPTLLLWNHSPHIDSLTNHIKNLPHVQAIFLTDEQYHIHEIASLNVATAILHWQDTVRKEIPATVGTTIVQRESTALTLSPALPTGSPLKVDNSIAEKVEKSQPAGVEVEAENPASPSPIQVIAFCVKCKQKRPMHNARRIVTKNGRNALEGICPVCSTKLFRFVSA